MSIFLLRLTKDYLSYCSTLTCYALCDTGWHKHTLRTQVTCWRRLTGEKSQYMKLTFTVHVNNKDTLNLNYLRKKTTKQTGYDIAFFSLSFDNDTEITWWKVRKCNAQINQHHIVLVFRVIYRNFNISSKNYSRLIAEGQNRMQMAKLPGLEIVSEFGWPIFHVWWLGDFLLMMCDQLISLGFKANQYCCIKF